MAMSTLYNLSYTSPVQITREVYNNVGASTFTLGDTPRAFKGSTDFEIWTASTGGTQLVEDTDYSLEDLDSLYTSEAGFNVYAGIDIINGAYQSGNIYITYKIIGSYTVASLFEEGATSVNNITANYTILDDDGYEAIHVNPESGDVIVTLPTLADNTGRTLKIFVTHLGGKVTLDGEGAETVNGDAGFVMQSKYDHVTVFGGVSEWLILSGKQSYDTGWINTNDWTNRHLGSSTVNYDGLSGTFTVGELITEATSANTGIIQSDTGSVLILKNVTGTGIFTDGRELTGGTSGATADVNESTSNKNADSNLLYDFDINSYNLIYNISASTDGTENNSFNLGQSPDWTTNSYGMQIDQTDSDSAIIQTGTSGTWYMDGSGAISTVNTQDWFYKIYASRVI